MKPQFQRALVIGASSGIGEAVALQLARSGAQVAVVARRASELERVAAAALPSGKGAIRTYPHDVRDFEPTAQQFEKIVADLGGLDLLVYAAGVMPKLAESEYNFAKDREMVEVNLLGAMAWMNPAAALFEANRSGTLVGIGSIAGERGRRVNPAYGTSKGALVIYLEALRNRVSRYGVNVVTVKPGYVDTAMTRGLPGLLWLISAQEAARQTLALAARGNSASGFVPAQWQLVAMVLRCIPSFLFRKLNF